MRLKVSVKNYRCFGGNTASGFVLSRGITGFIAGNNSGKSTMLRLFFDLRQLFGDLAEKLEQFRPGDDFTFDLPELPKGVDRDRFFHLHNEEPLVVELESGGCELDLIFRRDGQIRWKCGNMLLKESTIVRDLHTLSRMFYVGRFARSRHTAVAVKATISFLVSRFLRSVVICVAENRLRIVKR